MAIVKGRSFADAVLGDPTPDEIMIDLVMDFCVAVYDKMEAEGITRKELAERLGKSPSRITKILSGDNLTLKTMAEIDAALGLGLKLRATAGVPAESSARIESKGMRWRKDQEAVTAGASVYVTEVV